MSNYRFAVLSAVTQVRSGLMSNHLDTLEEYLVRFYGLERGASAFEAACDAQLMLSDV